MNDKVADAIQSIIIIMLVALLVLGVWKLFAAVDAADSRAAARRWDVTVETVAGKTTYTNVYNLFVGRYATSFTTEDGAVTSIKPVSTSYKLTGSGTKIEK